MYSIFYVFKYNVTRHYTNSSVSSQIQLDNCMSFGKIMTCLVCIAHRLVSSIRHTNYASVASWMPRTTLAWIYNQDCSFCNISFTMWNITILGMSNSADFWNFQISQRGFIPGLYLLGFFWIVSPLHYTWWPPMALFLPSLTIPFFGECFVQAILCGLIK